MVTPHSSIITAPLIACLTSLLCDRVIVAPQYEIPLPIAVSLRPTLREFQQFPMIPPNCGIAISRPELLPAMMKCLGHCPPEVRDMWFGGMASVIQSPSAAAAMYSVCDKLIQVGRNDGLKVTKYLLACQSLFN